MEETEGETFEGRTIVEGRKEDGEEGTSRGPPQLAGVDAHFDRTDGKWKVEDAKTGDELEWDGHGWVPSLAEDLVESQQAAYAVAGVDASEILTAKDLKRRRKEEEEEEKKPSEKRAKKKSTRIRITNLPGNATLEDVVAMFSKAGLILEDAEGNKRAKLYYDEQGRFTGEASVMYLQEESVTLAITLFDDTEFELGQAGPRMTVSELEYTLEETPKDKQNASSQTKTKTKKAGSYIAKQRQRLTDWSSDDERPKPQRVSTITVLKNMFTLQELEEDPALLLDLKEDVREECESLGQVTNVTLYDAEPEGVISVRFKDPVSAQACVIKMNGRFFGGKQVEAFLHDGRTRYKRSTHASELDKVQALEGSSEQEAKEKERLDRYAQWLEGQR